MLQYAILFIWENVDQLREHKPKLLCIKTQRTFRSVVFCKKPYSSRFCCRHEEKTFEMTAEDSLVLFSEKVFQNIKIFDPFDSPKCSLGLADFSSEKTMQSF